MKDNHQTSPVASFIRYLALILLILMPVAPLGSKWGIWPYNIGMLLLAVSLLGSLLIQIINSIWFMTKPTAATKNLLRQASLYALLPLLIVASMMRTLFGEGSEGGAIHNISTDTENPPAFVAAIERRGSDSNPLSYDQAVADIQKAKYPDLAPIMTTLPPQAAFNKALATATAMGWEVYASSAEAGTIEAVDSTFWFGFKDDIAICVTATEQGSKIDLRSVSRVGKGDMNTNANRIREYIAHYHQ